MPGMSDLKLVRLSLFQTCSRANGHASCGTRSSERFSSTVVGCAWGRTQKATPLPTAPFPGCGCSMTMGAGARQKHSTCSRCSKTQRLRTRRAKLTRGATARATHGERAPGRRAAPASTEIRVQFPNTAKTGATGLRWPDATRARAFLLCLFEIELPSMIPKRRSDPLRGSHTRRGARAPHSVACTSMPKAMGRRHEGPFRSPDAPDLSEGDSAQPDHCFVLQSRPATSGSVRSRA